MKQIIEWWESKGEMEKVKIKVSIIKWVVVIFIFILLVLWASRATTNFEWNGLKPIVMEIWEGTPK